MKVISGTVNTEQFRRLCHKIRRIHYTIYKVNDSGRTLYVESYMLSYAYCLLAKNIVEPVHVLMFGRSFW